MTGATGFLGSHLAKRLLAEGYRVGILKRARSDTWRLAKELPQLVAFDFERADLSDLFDRFRPGMILHCATDYGRKKVDFTQLVDVNLHLPLRLLQEADRVGTPLFINTDTFLDKRVSPYSLSKRQFDEWLRLYADRMGCVSMALEHFYGPGDDPSKFVSSIIANLFDEVDEIHLTPGLQSRDFIFIDDVINAFMHVIRAAPGFGKVYRRFEVGSGSKHTIRETVEQAKTISKNARTALKFGSLPYRENEVMETRMNLEPLLALGWKANWTLEAGLKKTWEGECQMREERKTALSQKIQTEQTL